MNVEVELSGEAKYKQAISELNAANKTMGAELKRLSAEYQENSDSMEFLAKKGDALQSMLQNQREKIEYLREAVRTAAEKYGEASTKTQSYAAQLASAEKSEIDLQRAIEENNRAIEEQSHSTSGFDEQLKMLASDLQVIDSGMAASGESVEGLRQKHELLSETLRVQEEKLQTLQSALNEATNSGTASEKELNDLRERVNEAQTAYNQTTAAINKNSEALQQNLAEIGMEQQGLTGLGDALSGLTEKFGVSLPTAAQTGLNSMGSFSTGTVAAIGAAATAVAAFAEGVKALHEMTTEYASKADDLITKSAQTGLSTEFLQAYQYAEQLVDVDLDAFIASMRKLTDQMDAARDGNEQLQKTFRDLGVQITDTTDGSLLPAEDVIMQVIDALHEMDNVTERNAVASELFGKSYQTLNPLISEGTEALTSYMRAAAENYNLTEDQIEVLEDLDNQIQMNNNQWEALKMQISAQFAPASKQALEEYGKLVEAAGNALIDSGIIEGTGEIFAVLSQMLSPLTELLSVADGTADRLRPVYEILHAIAGVLAWIQDAGNAAIGALTYLTPAGREKWNTALGYNAQYGQYSALQKWNGTADVLDAQLSDYSEYGGANMTGYGYDSNTGRYYDKKTGNYFYGYNAAGTDNWRGGLTWVGENGPELVNLPSGSKVLSAQESREAGGDTFYITIDAGSVKEFNDIVELAQRARVRRRMR